jgi:4,5-DOPA dioxygenase extradiol
MAIMPPLFISHGPPTVLLMAGKTADFLRSLGTQLPRPQGILCVSAHWEAVDPKITTTSHPQTIHDFGGPRDLFRMTYTAPGDAMLGADALELMQTHGFKAAADPQRGLDHGVWIPLKMMYPEADIPVVQLSVQTERDPEYHLALGKALRPLSAKGVLIMGSGGAVHNLDEIYQYQIDSTPPEYISAFDAWLEQKTTAGSVQALCNYLDEAPDARRAHPYPAEHFLPFFVPLGAACSDTVGRKIHHGFMFGTLSMAAYIWD